MSKAFILADDAGPQGDFLPERAIPPHPNLVIGKEIGDSVVVGGHEETIIALA
jgi:hypothetical protein